MPAGRWAIQKGIPQGLGGVNPLLASSFNFYI